MSRDSAAQLALDTLTLAEIRTGLHELVALAGTCEKPKPSHVLPPDHSMGPGREWVIDHRPHDPYYVQLRR
ncbi:hypothetical protein, partial [Streptomyces capuensis]|uniref:hypothetical protein n=1 Tax=Streptomyces capuensis TaxID=1464056 RepID=UPI0005196FA2